MTTGKAQRVSFLVGFVAAALLCVAFKLLKPYVIGEAKRETYNVSGPALNKDPGALISIRTADDVTQTRERLKVLLWGQHYASTQQGSAVSVTADFRDERYQSMEKLLRVDRVVVSMEFGLDSVIYQFVPVSPNGRLVLFHEGHDGDFFLHKGVIAAFVKRGYQVAAFSMPLLGMNSRPTACLGRQGCVTLENHAMLSYLRPRQGYPLRFFPEPVMRFLDFTLSRQSFDDIAMVGFSGGGWTTVLVAALDPRVKRSFPVAGSYPLYLASPRDWSDWEQWDPALYETASYLDLYVMGSSGPDRRQIQFFNRQDSCCFGGLVSGSYREAVQQRVQSLGPGNFDAFIDEDSTAHMFSDDTLRHILDMLELK